MLLMRLLASNGGLTGELGVVGGAGVVIGNSEPNWNQSNITNNNITLILQFDLNIVVFGQCKCMCLLPQYIASRY